MQQSGLGRAEARCQQLHPVDITLCSVIWKNVLQALKMFIFLDLVILLHRIYSKEIIYFGASVMAEHAKLLSVTSASHMGAGLCLGCSVLKKFLFI